MSHILIVEDNIDNAEILSIYLQSLNIPIKILYDGKNLMSEMIKDLPLLVFMDINLPNDDGRLLCSNIKRRFKPNAPPIIIMTASKERGHKRMARLMGADAFFEKPVSASDAIVEVKKLIGYKDI